MNEQETISDIIRKIRAEADLIEESARGSLKAGETLDGKPFTESDLESALDLAETNRKEADRLEAALGREKATAEKPSAVGDCAKLREALVKAQTALVICEWPDGTRMEGVAELMRQIDAALAAPPRNCDMPLVVEGPADNNADKAWLVFKRHNPDVYFDVSGLLRCIDFLLAPATEGGVK